jgi:hypothetical protein
MSTLHVENLKGLSSGGNANKIIVPSGQTLDASAGVLTPSSGQVIQRQVVVWTTVTDNSTETYADINGGTIDFTPKLSTSTLHITVHYHVNAYATGSTGNYAGGSVRILHDGSEISTQSGYENYWQSNVPSGGTNPNNFTRASKFVTVASGNTNSRTIKLQSKKYGSETTAFRFNQGGLYQSAIIVEEVV